jgi:hypothetical protein
VGVGVGVGVGVAVEVGAGVGLVVSGVSSEHPATSATVATVGAKRERRRSKLRRMGTSEESGCVEGQFGRSWTLVAQRCN